MLNSSIEVEQLDGEKAKQYVNETALEAQPQRIEDTYESGTVKIDEELAKLAKYAITSRIDATEAYTKERLARVNDGYKMYEQQILASLETKSYLNYPLIRDLVEDWVDDLYLMFSQVSESIDVECEDAGVMFAKKMGVESEDYEGKLQALFGLLKIVLKEHQEYQEYQETDVYYFKKTEIIKQFMKNNLKESQYLLKLEDFLRQGVLSGLFCFKGDYGLKNCNQIVLHKETNSTDEYIGLGEVKKTIIKKDNYRFSPVDTRRLIFPKNKINWCIEQIDTTFSAIIEETIGDDGKIAKNSPFDVKVLNKVKEYLKDNKELKLDMSDIYGDEEQNFDELYAIDGNCRIYECHNIPLRLGNKITKCKIVTLFINDEHIPISIMPTWFIDGMPYRFTVFAEKDNDVAGVGLPEILRELQSETNLVMNLVNDIIKLGVYGITVGNKDKIYNFEKLSSGLKPGQSIQVRDTEGADMKSVFDWLTPDTTMLPHAMAMLDRVIEVAKKISRKGPSGEKVAPNPSATEYSTMTQEAQKSVNRVGIRLNELMKLMLTDMYFYTMLNRNTNSKLKAKGKKITKEGAYVDIDKQIMISPEELVSNDIQFNVNVLDFDAERQAIEKQQIMQAIDLIYQVGITEQSTDPMTGQSTTSQKVFTDNSGNEVVINEYQLLRTALTKLDINLKDIFKQQNKTSQPQGAIAGSAPKAPDIPGLDASTQAGDILGGAMQVG
jgi:hypothetical protein